MRNLSNYICLVKENSFQPRNKIICKIDKTFKCEIFPLKIYNKY